MTPDLAPYVTNATRGEVRLVPESGTATLRGAAAAASLLFVDVPPLGPPARGQLGEFLEAAVEDALVRRGAAPPGVGASSDWDASLSDQLYRARHVGVRGIVVALGSLQAMTGGGVLDPDDSAALAFWAAATRERPVVLLVDIADRAVAGYRAPVRLDELLSLETLSEPPTETAPSVPPPALEDHAAAPARTPKLVDEGAWRRDAAELSAAKGPKPLAQVERLFVSRYVPLVEAVHRGVADPAAREVRAEWARSFAKSYAEAFAALRVTGKRPLMVFDLPQAAGRIARLHGARSVELLLVDAMRFDLGLRVHERLRDALEGKAACAERLLMWSAIPSTTATQLDLLAHGLEALSRPLAEDGDAGVARGRSVTSLRRMKVGARDLLKLDVVESRLRDPGPPVGQRLDAIADEVAPVVARHAMSLPDRTLLVVFGDHGFCLDDDGAGSGPATQGGASPDEVLVPAYAWLVGGVH